MSIPNSRPQLSEEKIRQILIDNKITDPVCLLGIRGYYEDSMGKKDANDRGQYDDAMFLVTRDKIYRYNANVDPSTYRQHIANLTEGVWRYKIGVHGLTYPVGSPRRYKALVQADEVTVKRDKEGLDTGWFGINIHRGGDPNTSSLGCQTIPPEQWPEFINKVENSLEAESMKSIPYVLVNNQGNKFS